MAELMGMFPTLSFDTQAIIRAAYGVLQLLTLVSALPHARRYFVSDRWGGYAQSGRATDVLQHPVTSRVVLAVWISCAVCLIVGRYVVAAAAINLVLCHYYFIRMRWRGVLRGMGAPGFISFWLGAAIFFLELTSRHAPGLRGLALFTLQVDFAFIMISAGIYKAMSGYRSGQGMELGMVNPEWGYWARAWRQWPPSHRLFQWLDELAWATEVFAGILMLFPATRLIGGLAILVSFVFIATQIRLGFLCEMVIVCCLLFIPAGGAAQQMTPTGAPLPEVIQQSLAVFFWAYLCLLPIVRVGMFYNQLAHKALPRFIQRGLDLYTNAFGLIIWRVFTADVVNFFVRIWEQRPGTGERHLLSDYEGFPGVHRFRQVAECIAVTSVFTTLKYYPSNRSLFVDRLMRYARTIPHLPASRLIFEWVGVVKETGRFAFVPVAEYAVDTIAGTIEDTVVSDAATVHGRAVASPVHEGLRPGTYAPLEPRT